MKTRMAVETPAYGLKTPEGMETMASSFCSSTRLLRRVLCALLDPKSTPSGTMTAARPPAWSRRRNRARKQQLGLLGLDDLLQVLCGGLVVETARERRIGEDQGVLLRVIIVGLGQRVLVADVWVLHAVQQHVHAADAQHRVVEVVAVERVLV